MPRKASFRIFDRTGNPAGVLTAFGRSVKAAEAKGRQILKRLRAVPRKNIFAGFYGDDGVFHPIRASADYDRARVGEVKFGRRKGKRKRRR